MPRRSLFRRYVVRPSFSLHSPARSFRSLNAHGDVEEEPGLEASDLKVIGVECDVSSERSVQKAYAEVIDTFGRVDSVVASAGASMRAL